MADVSKHITVSNFVKIRRVRGEFYVDGRTDGQKTDMKLTVAFRNFVNASKKKIIFKYTVRTAQ